MVSLFSIAAVQRSGVSVWQRGGSLPQSPHGENAEADLPGHPEVPEHADEAGDRKEATGRCHTADIEDRSRTNHNVRLISIHFFELPLYTFMPIHLIMINKMSFYFEGGVT